MSLEIRCVRLAHGRVGPSKLYNVICDSGIITGVEECIGERNEIASRDYVAGREGLLLPSLCHSHIHLDKCYILEKGDPLVTGDFQEALKVTAKVKATFKEDIPDLYDRADRLIRTSIQTGVTLMRAHVEVDTTVDDSCIAIGLELKAKWSQSCDIHISQFMQDPLFDSASDLSVGANAQLFAQVLRRYEKEISAVGSAPYVENTRAQQEANIRFILCCAIEHNLHADFHLDYNLAALPGSPDSDSSPLIYYLTSQLDELRWLERMPNKTVVVGHATRLSLLSPAQMVDLRNRIGDLPIHFVGLPQSDLYMMGRGITGSPRGTINVCQWRREYHLNVALAINNVGNAFTPQGTPDPLGLCTLGVALYQDGTTEGCSSLLEAVSINSKRAIGGTDARDNSMTLLPRIGAPADFVILHDNHRLESAALEPCFDRTTIKSGRVVAWRHGSSWVANE